MESRELDEVVATSPAVLREQAIRRLKKRRDFHAHLFVYAAVNLAFWGIWLLFAATSDSWYPWPLWVTVLWGLGVVFNAWDVYVRRPITEQEISREMDQLTHRASAPPR